MQVARTEPEQHRAQEASKRRAQQLWSEIKRWRYTVPVIYLAVALPLEVLVCFLNPPMQASDETRHFLRACQVAQGQVFPQIDPATHAAGGLLPAAVVEFVRDRMNPHYYRNENRLHTIGARLAALNTAAEREAPLSEKEFGVFPSAAVYAPALYLPQAAGIRLVRFFSDKVYIWFYAARVSNAAVAVLLIFFALLLAPAYQFLLLVPAILPMSLYQIASVSSDAALIGLSIFMVALCLRFIRGDGWLLRTGIILCLLLLTAGKPVYLPFALLLLPAYKRLGWRRTLLFCAAAICISAAAYVAWATCVRPVFALAGNDFRGSDPAAQAHFLLTHPVGVLMILLRTIRVEGRFVMGSMIGFFGWTELPFPQWFYTITLAFFAAIALLFLPNWKRVLPLRFLWGMVTVVGIVVAIVLAAWVMWTPVGSTRAVSILGRYFLPMLAALAFCFPPLYRLATRSRVTLAVLVFAFFAVSAVTTVRTLNHYYFPESKLLGKNLHAIFTITPPGSACPATTRDDYTKYWFSTIANGTANTPDKFRVVVADGSGTIWGESDPELSGREFPFDLLQGSSHRPWRIHFWRLNLQGTLDYWLIRGKTACKFGAGLKLDPYPLPSA